MPRLGHKKSRNGCRQCKARHVKCDEQKPCSSCARHGVQCSLITWDPNSPAPPLIKQEPSNGTTRRRASKTISRKNSQVPTPRSLPIEYVLNPSPAPTAGTSDVESSHSSHDPFPYLTKFLNGSESTQPNYWVRDLELMWDQPLKATGSQASLYTERYLRHHWTTEAYTTLSSREDVRQMWQNTAPKQAIIHQFLMHELLAYSALHMAYSCPGQRKGYYALGTHHQDLAIRAMRQFLPSMTPENDAPALFATSSLVLLTVLAANALDASRSNLQSPIDDLLDVFALVQGMHFILSSYAPIVAKHPIGILVSNHGSKEIMPPLPILDESCHHINDLLTLIQTEDIEEDVRTECVSAIITFQEFTQVTAGPYLDSRELRMMFIWPSKLSVNYLNMLRQKEPVAVAILAYYATILYAAESVHWFMSGWAQRIVGAISEIVDPSWLRAMQWPIQVVTSTISTQQQQERERERERERRNSSTVT
ncbi:uncharacterized protein BDR25DRAFT_315773 [Lindgomyces ingoldianus]|uniref:Uncharacterized protein n=1 Tax=Lindgomyces ingoldianus TaxID=673940 RepID=A0ACB6QRU8_9PLEO|nr:uncharacterized protein BDR25DRAFT_315773 [Lindgomyces ingoldianus]KAF2468802.1 hypothetical protein BDR25DRAFT_315773 [Lindgomyces ingoldianus]